MGNSVSCIDLISTNQPNLVIDSAVHPPLQTNCHHLSTFSQGHNKADTKKMKKSIEQVHWENILYHKNPHQQVAVFNKTIINIFPNFVPNRLTTCDNRDPHRMNEFVKNKIKWKYKIYKNYVKNGRTVNDYFKLQIAINDVSEIIDKRRNDYNCHLAPKLNNPKASSETYWSVLKSFYSGKEYHSFLPYCIIIP